jgi:hypothetical protein
MRVLVFDRSKSDAAANRVPEHASLSSQAGIRGASLDAPPFTRRELSESPMRSVLLRMESGGLGHSPMVSLEL